jgi:hypothetical protein
MSTRRLALFTVLAGCATTPAQVPVADTDRVLMPPRR